MGRAPPDLSRPGGQPQLGIDRCQTRQALAVRRATIAAGSSVSGLGWFAFQSPTLTSALSTYLEILGFIAELSFMLWLLIKGVNGQRWSELAAHTRPR